MFQPIDSKYGTAGNTLVEYVLIATVLCIGCISIFMQISQDFSDHMDGLKTDMQQHEQKAQQTQQHVQQIQAMRAAIYGGSGGASTDGGNLQGQQQAIFTAGSNGGKLNAFLNSDGTQIALADENLSPVQQDAFKNLSNQAHKIAQMEALIEQASAASGGDMQKFHNARIAYNGDDTYSVYYLASNMYSKELKNFDDMKMQLLQSGTLSINALNYLNGLVNDVKTRASAVDSLTHSNDTSGISSLSASVSTHQDGKQICTTGQHQDEGTQCN